MIEAWNKIDMLPDYVREGLIEELAQQEEREAAIPVSAVTGDGMPSLIEAIENMLDQGRARVRVKLTNRDGAFRAWLYENTQVEEEIYTETGEARLILSLTRDELGRLAARYPKELSSQIEKVD